MLWQFYLYKGKAYVPTVGKTTAGFYMSIEPVRVAPIESAAEFASALKEAINSGNPGLPTPTRATFPKPVILKYAKVRTWEGFEEKAENWTIEEKDDGYWIKPGKRRDDGCGWEDDPSRVTMLARKLSIDEVASQVVSLVLKSKRLEDV